MCIFLFDAYLALKNDFLVVTHCDKKALRTAMNFVSAVLVTIYDYISYVMEGLETWHSNLERISIVPELHS